MRLSLHTDYALRVLMFLAGAGRRCTVSEITEFYKISRDHVAKVTARLARSGYIRALRGAGGGLEMARAAEEICVGKVVAEFEGTLQLLECVTAEEIICRIQPGCKLRHVLAKAEKVQQDYLDSVHLSDIVKLGQSLEKMTKYKPRNSNSKKRKKPPC